MTKLRGMGAFLLAATVATAGCGGSGDGSGGGTPLLEPGSVIAMEEGGTITVYGRVAFRDPSGGEASGPPGGVLVVAGAGSRAVATDELGEFAIDQLPFDGDIPVTAGAPGWKPGEVEIENLLVTYADVLVLLEDPDPIDDPVLDDDESAALTSQGRLLLRGLVPRDTLVKAFHLPEGVGGGPLPRTPVDLADIEYRPGPAGTTEWSLGLNTAQDPEIRRGVLHLYALHALYGVTLRSLTTCDLEIEDYGRNGRTISGTVMGPGGACAGADVMAWCYGEASDVVEGDATPQGYFKLVLPHDPDDGLDVPVGICVEWVDGNGDLHVCAFPG